MDENMCNRIGGCLHEICGPNTKCKCDDEKNKNLRQLERIQKISNIRTNNNRCWMQILRVAWLAAPKETAKIFKEIQENDKEINNITKEMCDEELPG